MGHIFRRHLKRIYWYLPGDDFDVYQLKPQHMPHPDEDERE